MTKDEIIKRYVEAVTIATTSIARKIVMPCEYDDVEVAMEWLKINGGCL